MGRACSKVVPQEISIALRSATSRSEEEDALLESMLVKLAATTEGVSAAAPPPATATTPSPLRFASSKVQLRVPEMASPSSTASIRPPHEQLHAAPARAAGRGLEFYVSIQSLRVRHLPVPHARGSSAHQNPSPAPASASVEKSFFGGAAAAANPPSYVAIVSWDNNSRIVRTSFEQAHNGTLTFPGHWSFLWQNESGADDLTSMRHRYLMLALFRLEHRQVALIGHVKVDLLSITVGPIHHDFALKKHGDSHMSHQPRIQFDCRLTQICQLSCIPVEVLVDVEVPAASKELSTSRQASNNQLQALAAAAAAKPERTSMPPKAKSLAVLLAPDTRPNTPTSATAMTDSRAHTSSPSPPLEDVPRRPKVHSCDVTTIHLDKTSAPASPSEPEEPEDHAAQLEKKLSAVQGLVVGDASLPTEDERRPVKAEWKVDFAVTGIPSVSAASSNWTAVTDAPYWNIITEEESPEESRLLQPVGLVNSGEEPSLLDQELLPPSLRGFRPEVMVDTPLKSNGGSFKAAEIDRVNSGAHVTRSQLRYSELAAECLRSGDAFRGADCPSLTPFFLATSSEGIRQYYLHIKLWNKPLGVGPARLFGETLVPFFKLFDADVLSYKCRGFLDVRFREVLWNDGRTVGHISTLMVFQDIPLLRQMFTGVSTEQGFRRLITPSLVSTAATITSGTTTHNARSDVLASSESIVGSAPLTEIPAEVQTLLSLTRELQKHWLKTNVIHAEKVNASNGVTSGSNSGRAQQQMLSNKLMTNMSSISERVVEVLTQSSDDTSLMNSPIFQYPTIEGLMFAQRLLIELADHILQALDHVPWNSRGVFGNIMILILRRGELEIGNLLPTVPDCVPAKIPNAADVVKRILLEGNHVPTPRMDTPSPFDTTTSTGGLINENNSPLVECDRRSAELTTPTDQSMLNDSERSELLIYDRRMKIARLYVMMCVRLLEFTSAKLQCDALFESQRRQIAVYYAYLYNRFPTVRRKILQMALTNEERECFVSEWRGSDFSLDKSSLREEWTRKPVSDNEFLIINLDWTPLHNQLAFYYASGGGCNEEALVSKVLGEPSAVKWVQPRSVTFYLFLNSWVKITTNQLRTTASGVRWDLIPGYGILLKGILIDLRTKPVNKFPDSLLQCTSSLLQYNDKLLAVFIRIILTRTSLYSREQVFMSLNYLDYWFEVFARLPPPNARARPQFVTAGSLPLTMDYRLLSRAIESIINSDLALQCAKIIWLIYKRMDLFAGQKSMIKIIMDLLINKHFYPLILHWSYLVRKCFTHFILYRLCESVRRISTAAHNRVAHAGGLSIEDRLLCWTYIMIMDHLKRLGIPPVFPPKFASQSLTKLLAQTLPPHQKNAPAILLWSLPTILPTLQPMLQPRPTPKAAAVTINASPISVGRLRAIRRTGFKFRRRRSLDEPERPEGLDDDILLLQDPTGIDDVPIFEYESPEQFLPPPQPLSPTLRPYINHLVQEFASVSFKIDKTMMSLPLQELEQYKMWVISGNSEVPAMHIPASPLDTNVDVPLDDDG